MSVRKFSYSYFLLLIFLTVLTACIDPYDVDVGVPRSGLIVEGIITTLPGPQEVKLTRFAPYGLRYIGFNQPEISAKVAVRDDLGKTYIFTENSDPEKRGVYFSDASFKVEVGRTYSLEIELRNGKKYLSRAEKVNSLPRMDSVSYEAVKIATDNRYVDEVGVRVTGYFQDPGEDQNFYFWKTLESTFVLVSEPDAPGTQYGAPGGCCSRCFHTDLPKPSNVFLTDDSDFNGKYQQRPIAYVFDDGMRFKETYRLDVLSLSVSQRAYQFLKLVDQQLRLTGSVFDPAIANIRGNVLSLDDPEEQVLGYFMASDAELLRVYIQKSKLKYYSLPVKLLPFDCRLYLVLMDPLGRNPVRPPLLPVDPPDDWEPGY